jgi:lipoprotein Spr
MSSSPHAEAAVARARALIGVRFLPQGRDPGRGLDCVGLVASALAIEPAPRCYELRSGSLTRLAVEMASAGLAEAQPPMPGDVLVACTGPGQLHLGLWTGTSLIHADAGLRRVVERPAPMPWPLVGIWRLVTA